jgi:hypothetical protein
MKSKILSLLTISVALIAFAASASAAPLVYVVTASQQFGTRATQEVALLHLGTGRMVAGSDMLRTIPASSRQGRTSCLDESVISLAVSNFGKGPKARTYGSFAIGTEKFHQ